MTESKSNSHSIIVMQTIKPATTCASSHTMKPYGSYSESVTDSSVVKILKASIKCFFCIAIRSHALAFPSLVFMSCRDLIAWQSSDDSGCTFSSASITRHTP